MNKLTLFDIARRAWRDWRVRKLLEEHRPLLERTPEWLAMVTAYREEEAARERRWDAVKAVAKESMDSLARAQETERIYFGTNDKEEGK